MDMMRKFAILLAVAVLSACTAATDFDMPGDAEPYILSENLPTSVNVALDGTGTTGSLTLALTAALPSADDDALLALLDNGTIEITVSNNDTLVSFNLTDGTRVYAAPTAAGEYYLSLDAARTALTIQFYNETTTGNTLQSGDACTASFSVMANDYFATEEFTRLANVL